MLIIATTQNNIETRFKKPLEVTVSRFVDKTKTIIIIIIIVMWQNHLKEKKVKELDLNPHLTRKALHVNDFM